jgi:cobalt-zinc-cadmium resistance protein CzcA
MKTQTILLLIGGVFLIPTLGNSQQRLTLDEAIQTARQNNAGLKSAALEVEYQRQLKRTATEIPKTSAMLMYGQYNSINQDNNITITQSLPFPTVFTSQSKLGEIRVQSSEFRRSSTENELIFQVKQVYLMIQFLSARQKLLQRQDSIFSDLVKISSLQQKTGEGTLLQKTSAEARFNEVQNLRRQNEADQKVYESQFRILLNTDIASVPADEPLKAFTTTLLNDSAQIEKNPLLAFQKSLADVAWQEKKVEVNKALPDLTIGYFNQTLIGYQQFTDGTNPYFASGRRFDGITAGIAIPLWFLPHNAKIKSASIRAEAARYSTNYYRKQLSGQWEKAVQEFYKNKNSIEYYTQSALPNAKLILRQSQLAYQTGELSQAEYRLNLQQALSIEEGYLQSLLQYNQSIIMLEFLSGESVKN